MLVVTGSTAIGTMEARIFEAPSTTVAAQPELSDLPERFYRDDVILSFYEFTSPDGEVLRLVDFGDPEAGATLGEVDFDSQSWTTFHLSRSDITTDFNDPLNGTIVCLDPTLAIRRHLNEHGVYGGTCKIRFIEWRNIGSPGLSIDHELTMQTWAPLEGPSRVTISIGAPADMPEIVIPQVFYSRFDCPNAYDRRFDHLEGYESCNYPSMEFKEQTRQTFLADVDTETLRSYGWFVLNATKPSLFRNGGDLGSAEYLLCTVNTQGSWDWAIGSRNGVYAYRKLDIPVTEATKQYISRGISDQDLEFDVVAKFRQTTFGSDKVVYGLLVQSIADPEHWFLWGFRVHDSTYDQLCRRYSDGTTTTSSYWAHTIGQSDTESIAFRLSRTGNVWKVQWREEDPSEDWDTVSPTTWTDPSSPSNEVTLSWFDFSKGVNVGFLCAQDDAANQGITGARFYYLRFLKGGLTTCKQSLGDCIVHRHTHRYNGMSQMIDGRSIIAI